mgnify:CR=1 FL=1
MNHIMKILRRGGTHAVEVFRDFFYWTLMMHSIFIFDLKHINDIHLNMIRIGECKNRLFQYFKFTTIMKQESRIRYQCYEWNKYALFQEHRAVNNNRGGEHPRLLNSDFLSHVNLENLNEKINITDNFTHLSGIFWINVYCFNGFLTGNTVTSKI